MTSALRYHVASYQKERATYEQQSMQPRASPRPTTTSTTPSSSQAPSRPTPRRALPPATRGPPRTQLQQPRQQRVPRWRARNPARPSPGPASQRRTCGQHKTQVAAATDEVRRRGWRRGSVRWRFWQRIRNQCGRARRLVRCLPVGRPPGGMLSKFPKRATTATTTWRRPRASKSCADSVSAEAKRGTRTYLDAVSTVSVHAVRARMTHLEEMARPGRPGT